jgi:hypothetical protein
MLIYHMVCPRGLCPKLCHNVAGKRGLKWDDIGAGCVRPLKYINKIK